MKNLIALWVTFSLLGSSNLCFATTDTDTEALLSQAGGVNGGGADAVVCKTGNTTSVELLDFYEGMQLGRLVQIDSGKGNLPEKTKYILNKLKQSNPYFHEKVKTLVLRFKQDAKFLKGKKFVDIPDSNHLFLPKNCEIEQVAIQPPSGFETNYKYFVNWDIWQKMNIDQKLGIVLHEVIYYLARQLGHKNSVRVRKLVAKVFDSRFQQLSQKDFLLFLVNNQFLQTTIYSHLNFMKGYSNYKYHPNGMMKQGRLSKIKPSYIYVFGQPVELDPGVRLYFFKTGQVTTIKPKRTNQSIEVPFGFGIKAKTVPGSSLSFHANGRIEGGRFSPDNPSIDLRNKNQPALDVFLSGQLFFDKKGLPYWFTLQRKTWLFWQGKLEPFPQGTKIRLRSDRSLWSFQLPRNAPAKNLQFLGKSLLVREVFYFRSSGKVEEFLLIPNKKGQYPTLTVKMGKAVTQVTGESIVFHPNGSIRSGYLISPTAFPYFGGTLICNDRTESFVDPGKKIRLKVSWHETGMLKSCMLKGTQTVKLRGNVSVPINGKVQVGKNNFKRIAHQKSFQYNSTGRSFFIRQGRTYFHENGNLMYFHSNQNLQFQVRGVDIKVKANSGHSIFLHEDGLLQIAELAGSVEFPVQGKTIRLRNNIEFFKNGQLRSSVLDEDQVLYNNFGQNKLYYAGSKLWLDKNEIVLDPADVNW